MTFALPSIDCKTGDVRRYLCEDGRPLHRGADRAKQDHSRRRTDHVELKGWPDKMGDDFDLKATLRAFLNDPTPFRDVVMHPDQGPVVA